MRFTTVIAKFHYTDPTGPARTQRSFAAKKVRAGPWVSGRVRVGSVLWNLGRLRQCARTLSVSGPVRVGPCSGI